jgi:hypothetical protein
MNNPEVRKKQLAKHKKISKKDVYSSKHVRIQENCIKKTQVVTEYKSKGSNYK